MDQADVTHHTSVTSTITTHINNVEWLYNEEMLSTNITWRKQTLME